MKQYAEENKLLTQPRRMLKSPYQRYDYNTLFNIYPNRGLECTQTYPFVQYNPLNCFKSFVQSEVMARRQDDKNPHSSAVAETMKRLANSSYGYQIIDMS